MTADVDGAADTSGARSVERIVERGREYRPIRSVSSARAVAALDSSTAMVRTTGYALRGESASLRHAARRGEHRLRRLLAGCGGALPDRARVGAYAWLGAAEGLRPEQVGSVDLAEVAAWITGQYRELWTGESRFPGVVIGSANGALTHLCTATGMPWLPQTVRVPVGWSDNDPDDGIAAMEYGRRIAPALLDANPDVRLHHVHDPNQDRLMVGRTAYFRLKWWRLPAAYIDFITERLAPGAPIVIFEDSSAWPVTEVADRHVYQPGAHGGLSVEDYLDGSSRVRDFLLEQRSPRSRFANPEPSAHHPEAEWGYDADLTESIVDLAEATGHPVLRLQIAWPQMLSGPVADLMRRRLRGAGARADRLMVESYVMLDPIEAIRTGSVPYWTFLGVQPARHAVQRYLAGATAAEDPYESARVMLFPHGVPSAGVAPPGDWRALGEHLTDRVGLVPGVERTWPTHFDSLTRYGPWLRAMPTEVSEVPPLMPVQEALEGVADGEDVTLSRLR